MEKSLIEMNKAFTIKYWEMLDEQIKIKKYLENYHFNLEKNEITDAILERMYAFWHFNVTNNKELIERHTNSEASDFFTETCLLFVKMYFWNRYDVVSEKSIVTGKKPVKPDISIWKENKLIGVIEIKVSDGWKGKNIMQHLIDRENTIKTLCNNKNLAFGVIAFWNFFDENQLEFNSKFIGLQDWKTKKYTGKVENLLKFFDTHFESLKY